MAMRRKGGTGRLLIGVWTASVLAFLYVPMIAVVLASFSRQRYFRFPVASWSTKWYEKAGESLSVRDLVWTSLTVAALVTVFSVVLAFFGALAFAKHITLLLCCIQWNPSIMDTIGNQHSVRYSEVSPTQGLLVYFR